MSVMESVYVLVIIYIYIIIYYIYTFSLQNTYPFIPALISTLGWSEQQEMMIYNFIFPFYFYLARGNPFS